MRYTFIFLSSIPTLIHGSPFDFQGQHIYSGLASRNSDANYGSLSVPTTAEPLDKWATSIYAKTDKTKEVYVDFNTEQEYKPTSLFQRFGDSEFYMTLTGLYGCTSVVVTSYCGAYMSHFWSPVMNDKVYESDKNVFIAGAADALQGVRNKAAEAAANKNKAPAALIPNSDFISLKAHETCLSAPMGAKAFIFTPISSSDAPKAKDPKTVGALQAIVADLTGLTSKDVAIHTYQTPGETTAKAKNNGKGKVLLTYSPNTKATGQEHAYQVHVSKMDSPSTTMALGDTWTGDANKCTCASSPLKVKKHDKSCCVVS